ncbi:hypothetical protein BVRB_023290, partial [Beta vulgaris subsp. vulgaris]
RPGSIMPLLDLVDDSGDDADSAMDVVSMSQQLSEPQFPSASTSLFELHPPPSCSQSGTSMAGATERSGV